MVANAAGGNPRGDWRRRRNLRWGLSALALLAVIGIITVWPRSGDSSEVATAPTGEPTTTLDTTPFEMIDPGDGPTTIPEGVLQTSTTTTAPPPPPSNPVSTTTAPPLAATTTTLPIPGTQRDPVCQGIVELITMVRNQDRATPVEEAKERSTARLTRLRDLLKSADADQYRAAVMILNDALSGIAKATRSDQVSIIVVSLVDSPSDAARAAFEPVVAHANSACPDVLAAR